MDVCAHTRARTVGPTQVTGPCLIVFSLSEIGVAVGLCQYVYNLICVIIVNVLDIFGSGGRIGGVTFIPYSVLNNTFCVWECVRPYL